MPISPVLVCHVDTDIVSQYNKPYFSLNKSLSIGGSNDGIFCNMDMYLSSVLFWVHVWMETWMERWMVREMGH